jgi:hypothetical protein
MQENSVKSRLKCQNRKLSYINEAINFLFTESEKGYEKEEVFFSLQDVEVVYEAIKLKYPIDFSFSQYRSIGMDKELEDLAKSNLATISVINKE